MRDSPKSIISILVFILSLSLTFIQENLGGKNVGWVNCMAKLRLLTLITTSYV